MRSSRECDEVLAIRAATVQDVEWLAYLCGQLGYPSMPGQMRRRLDQVQRTQDQAVFVAERPCREVIGWVQVFVRRLLVVDRHAELGGLVVAEDWRGCGVGRLLMEQAEDWAGDRGCEAVYVRSNVHRERASGFYLGIGYQQIKTSRLFLKELPASG